MELRTIDCRHFLMRGGLITLLCFSFENVSALLSDSNSVYEDKIESSLIGEQRESPELKRFRFLPSVPITEKDVRQYGNNPSKGSGGQSQQSLNQKAPDTAQGTSRQPSPADDRARERQQQAAGGGKEPPEGRRPPSNVAKSDNEAKMKEGMVDVLKKFKRKLDKKLDFKVIIVMDLDDTLYHEPEFQLHLWQRVQSAWFGIFDEFLQENKERIYLIYNTSRLQLSSAEQLVVRNYNDAAARGVSLDVTGLYGSRELVQMMVSDPDQLARGKMIGIPKADVLITNGGMHIQPRGRVSQMMSNQAEVNRQFSQWLSEDQDHYESVSGMAENQLGMNVSKSDSVPSMSMFYPERSSRAIELAQFNSGLKHSVSELVISPVPYKSKGKVLVKKAYAQNVSINKGSGLRVVLHFMHAHLPSDQLIFLAIFVDHITDLSMLRPDMEAEALGGVRPEALIAREARYGALGIKAPKMNDYSRWWRLSVVAPLHPTLNPSIKNSAISASLKHPNVVFSASAGLQGLLSDLVENLPE